MNYLLTEEFARKSSASDGGRLVHSTLQGQSLTVTSPQSSLKYVLSGEEDYVHGGRKIRLRKGDLLIVKAGEILNVDVPSGSPATGLCIYFTDVNIDGLTTPLLHLPANSLYQESSAKLSTLIRSQNFNTASLKEGFQKLCEIGREITQEKAIVFEGLIKRHKNAAPSLFHKLERTRIYIENRNGIEVDLNTLSSIASLSKHHYCRLFKEVYGSTPMQYSKEKRMDLARQLLHGNQKSISEISHILGFADQPSFTKAFKKTYGHPPSMATHTL